MKLEGSLDTFSLPDILQLLAFTKKTGALQLSAKTAAPRCRARRRRCRQRSRIRCSRQSLARRVVGRQRWSVTTRSRRGRQRRRRGLGASAALLDAGPLTEEAVLPVARQQVIDAVCDLLRWPEGEFAFFVDELDPDKLSVSVSVEDLVAEGQRRMRPGLRSPRSSRRPRPRCRCRSRRRQSTRPAAARSGHCSPWSTAVARVARSCRCSGGRVRRRPRAGRSRRARLAGDLRRRCGRHRGSRTSASAGDSRGARRAPATSLPSPRGRPQTAPRTSSVPQSPRWPARPRRAPSRAVGGC